MSLDRSIPERQKIEFMEFLNDLLHERHVDTYVDIYHELTDYLHRNPPHDYRSEVVNTTANTVGIIMGEAPVSKPDSDVFPPTIRDIFL